MAELIKSCSNCIHRKNKYEFGDSGRITFFCYSCMMDGRNKFTSIDHTTEKWGSEAIKEFAERLKEKLQWDVEFDNKLVFESDIDNLVKEMTEVEANQRKEDESNG